MSSDRPSSRAGRVMGIFAVLWVFLLPVGGAVDLGLGVDAGAVDQQGAWPDIVMGGVALACWPGHPGAKKAPRDLPGALAVLRHGAFAADRGEGHPRGLTRVASTDVVAVPFVRLVRAGHAARDVHHMDDATTHGAAPPVPGPPVPGPPVPGPPVPEG